MYHIILIHINFLLYSRKFCLIVYNYLSLHLIIPTRFSLEYLTGQVSEIKKKVDELRKKMKKSPDDLQAQLKTFLREADTEVSLLESSVKEVEEMNKLLADYFCEDPKKFKPEECMGELNMFLMEFESAVKVWDNIGPPE